MFDPDVVRDVQAEKPIRQPPPDRRNEFEIFSDENFINGSVCAKDSELFGYSVVNQSFAKNFSVSFHKRKNRIFFHKYQNLKKNKKFKTCQNTN